MTEKIYTWLDCDPGHDDMLAIILAAMNQRIQLVGISTSAGNSTIQNTTRNALNILQQLNKNQIDVYQGSSSPLCAQLVTAPQIHGQTGLQGSNLKISKKRPIIKNSFTQIYNKISQYPNKIHFVVTGAMTNLAILLKAFPDIINYLSHITIMGGAIGLGNLSPAAQFNIVTDPQAAQIIFNCGIKVNMVPLDVTHKVLMTQQIFQDLLQINTQFSKNIYNQFRYFQKSYKQLQDFDYPPTHDPVTIYYLLFPDNTKGKDCFVQIQLTGKSRGRTNCQFLHYKRANCHVLQQIDVNHFWSQMIGAIKRII